MGVSDKERIIRHSNRNINDYQLDTWWLIMVDLLQTIHVIQQGMVTTHITS